MTTQQRAQKTTSAIKATRTSLRIVRAVMDLDGATVSDLATHLDMPVSTVHDHLRTLMEESYLTVDDKEYAVAAAFLELGGYARSRMDIYQVGVPQVDKLADETGEHANLMIEEHGRGIFLYVSKGNDARDLDTFTGMRVDLHTTALGKAILAYSSEQRVEEILDQQELAGYTPRTISAREELYDELETVRQRGYAIDDEERLVGVCCAAVPIRHPDGSVLGAVSVSGPAGRMSDEMLEEELMEKLSSTANVIEVNLTYG